MSQQNANARRPSPPADVYTFLLGMTLLALIIGCIMLYLEIQTLPKISEVSKLILPASTELAYGIFCEPKIV